MGDRVTAADEPDGVIVLAGELDAFGAATADEALTALSSTDDGVVDMARVTFVDSAGLRVLLRHSERLRAGDGRLHLRNASDGLRQLITLTGLGAAFVLD